MTMRVLCAAGAIVLATGPVAAGNPAALADASARLFDCFGAQWLEAERRNWSELVYYRAIRARCAVELDAFAEANGAGTGSTKVTDRALRGALVDAALDYGRAIAFR